MQQADGALGDGVVAVVERGQDARQVAQRRDLVGQLALRAEQTHCCRGNRLQGLSLQGSGDVQAYNFTVYWCICVVSISECMSVCISLSCVLFVFMSK